MGLLKRIFKQNTHNLLFKGIADFGRSVNRFYENRNHDIESNGEVWLIRKMKTLQPITVFDVGANTGKYCEAVLTSLKESRIYCFEPVSKTFDTLRSKINDERVVLIQKGLYSEDKKLAINLYPSHTHASIFELKAVPYESTGTEEIELIRGDDFIRTENIKAVGLLKLDIEGAELDALRGLENSFRTRIIRAVQFEYGYINITTRNLLADYYDFFKSVNYVVGKLYPKSVEFRDYKFKHEDFIGPNFVAIHRDDHELRRILKS